MRVLPAHRGPSFLTSFVGRKAELDHLVGLLAAHRLVTATGPGGVGKTRLALAVAEAVEDRFADGLTFVDLVTVNDEAMVVGAVAAAVGVPDQPGRTRLDGLLGALRDRDLLLVLDNCEHLLGGVRPCVAAVVDGCPSVRVLATSRTRLLLPGEVVGPVPGLSVGEPDDGHGEAIELLRTRAVEAGAAVSLIDDDPLAAAGLCDALDGLALGIELAAARIPSLGVDGVRRALAEGPELLVAVHARDARHLSLPATIEWSYRLLADEHQRVLRAGAVFAAPFTVDAVAALIGERSTLVAQRLGQLADSSLVAVRPGPPTRYRMLETIRQFADARAAELDERDALRTSHRRWCHDLLEDLSAQAIADDAWCVTFDGAADEVRAALARATAGPAGDEDEHGHLAELFGNALLRRGALGEAQARYEEAARFAADGSTRRSRLELAAGSALARYAGDDAVARLDEVVALAEQDGDDDVAALVLARIATILHRHAGTMNGIVDVARANAALARARRLGAGNDHVTTAILIAEATRFDRIDVAADAVVRARASGDALLVHAALDAVTGAHLAAGDLAAAAACVAERFGPELDLPADARSAMELLDAHLMGVHVNLAIGRLPAARHHADALAALPFVREEQHVARARRIEVEAIAGRFDEALAAADRFEESWIRAGRPQLTTFGSVAHGVAMVHGLRGDDERRAEWTEIARRAMREPGAIDPWTLVWPKLFEGLVALDRDQLDLARAELALAPDEFAGDCSWSQRLWLAWYAAAWAEAGIRSGEDVDEVVRRARPVAGSNDAAQTLIDRALAHAAGDDAELERIARRLDRLGCEYQAARTRQWAAPPPGSDRLGTLTRRERDVLGLVAAGLSNPQIAGQLHISPKTAEHHVSNILAKLDVATRAAAAALAAGTP